MRSHTCGQVTDSLIGKEVTLAGWVNRRRDRGGVVHPASGEHRGTVRARRRAQAKKVTFVQISVY